MVGVICKFDEHRLCIKYVSAHHQYLFDACSTGSAELDNSLFLCHRINCITEWFIWYDCFACVKRNMAETDVLSGIFGGMAYRSFCGCCLSQKVRQMTSLHLKERLKTEVARLKSSAWYL